MHIAFAFDVVDTVRREEPDLFDASFRQVGRMLTEAVECETQFAEDLLGKGVPGLPLEDMRAYLEYVADRRLTQLGLTAHYHATNPLTFMGLQDVQELSNFFERRVSAYRSRSPAPSAWTRTSKPAGLIRAPPGRARKVLFRTIAIR